jgi:4'-phosphopantetheinyl transferase
MIKINISTIKNIDNLKYNLYLSLLSKDMQKDILRYRLEDDRRRSLLGKITLLNYFNRYTNFNLVDIERTSYNRPYIKNSNVDFNISHSKDYVVCAFSKNNSIGIDIEALNFDININDFKSIFSRNEFDLIINSNKSIEIFYKLWTIKEAILKADGRGFIAEPKDITINIEQNRATLKNRIYNIRSFKIDEYIYSLAFVNDMKISIETEI